MRFYNKNHDFYCGIDLHSTKMYLCILTKDGEKVLHRNMKFSPQAFLKAIHGGKAKNDRIDAFKIASILRGGTLPKAYVYPRAMRSTRDLLRRRSHMVTIRGDFLAHAQMSHYQHALSYFSFSLISANDSP